MFKLGYQAFIMMMIASAYIIFRIFQNKSPNPKAQMSKQVQKSNGGFGLKFGFVNWKLVYLSLLIPQLFLISIYPKYAIESYYGGLLNYKGLYGLNWLKQEHPDNYEVVQWFRNQFKIPNSEIHNVPFPPTILEAVGDSYTDYARISANTGLPTVLGWPVHEWLWRGKYDEAGKRTQIVQDMYTNINVDKVGTLLRYYNVHYVIVGDLERQKYTNLNEDNFRRLGSVVFQSGNTRVYIQNYLTRSNQ
jgi:uncharacterized membrane protein